MHQLCELQRLNSLSKRMGGDASSPPLERKAIGKCQGKPPGRKPALDTQSNIYKVFPTQSHTAENLRARRQATLPETPGWGPRPTHSSHAKEDILENAGLCLLMNVYRLRRGVQTEWSGQAQVRLRMERRCKHHGDL